jgi:hypothetical protein
MNARIYTVPLIGLHGVDRDHVTCIVVWMDTPVCIYVHTRCGRTHSSANVEIHHVDLKLI